VDLGDRGFAALPEDAQDRQVQVRQFMVVSHVERYAARRIGCNP
jgi:hypothetical protein